MTDRELTMALRAETVFIRLTATFPRAGLIQVHGKDEGVGLEEDELEMLFSEGIRLMPTNYSTVV